MLGFEDTRPLNLVIPLKQAKAIGKHLDIHTCGELLRHYPRRYLHYGTGADSVSYTHLTLPTKRIV